MRFLVLALPALTLMACTPTGPNRSGVGFGDYGAYLAQREAELVGQRQAAIPAPQIAPAQPVVAAAAPAPVPANSGYGAAPLSALAPSAIQPGAAVPTAVVATPVAGGDQSLGQEALATLAATSPTPAAPSAPVVPAAPAPVAAAPAPVVQGSAGPNLAAYALSATNGMGQQIYDRGGFHLTDSGKACAKYISPDLAQMAFLEKGGPHKDSLNLDPDGDGFACGWDPRPFQAARQ